MKHMAISGAIEYIEESIIRVGIFVIFLFHFINWIVEELQVNELLVILMLGVIILAFIIYDKMHIKPLKKR